MVGRVFTVVALVAKVCIMVASYFAVGTFVLTLVVMVEGMLTVGLGCLQGGQGDTVVL